MFYCDKCRKKMSWPEGFSKSYGPCELCGKTSVCNEVHSKHLMDKDGTLKERRDHE